MNEKRIIITITSLALTIAGLLIYQYVTVIAPEKARAKLAAQQAREKQSIVYKAKSVFAPIRDMFKKE